MVGSLTVYGALKKLSQQVERLEGDCAEITKKLVAECGSTDTSVRLDHVSDALSEAKRLLFQVRRELPYNVAVDVSDYDGAASTEEVQS